ncbi:serine/threonine-protein kinase PLK4-like [Gordionus sp. m RMFG-2023]|uniref:serine/threonine-protein kinase PLK4-like n=1 Tax=Gordionus sp. m RMFG-2023 TaxID=3053472 RepID=UPI0031FD4C34
MLSSRESNDDYEVYNILGKGSFASVFRAVNKNSRQEVAIKMIDKKIMKAKGMISRVRNEVEIHSQLKHSSLLELYDYFEDKQYVYIILELCHMGELGTYVAYNKSSGKGVNENQACRFMKQILEGVYYLHSHQIVHRDLTVSNILLDKNLNVKIADFGLAIHLKKPDEKHFTMCGTPNFISPETVLNSPHGMKVDIWSLGCIMYTLLCGLPPFDTQNIESTFNKIISGKFFLPAYLSSNAKDLIYRFLRTEPSSRINLEEALKHPFITNVISSSKSDVNDSTMIFRKFRLPQKSLNLNPDQCAPKQNYKKSDDIYNNPVGKKVNGLRRLNFTPKLSILEENEYSSNHEIKTNLGTIKNSPSFVKSLSGISTNYNETNQSLSPNTFVNNLRQQLQNLNLRLNEKPTDKEENQTKHLNNHDIITNDKKRLKLSDLNPIQDGDTKVLRDTTNNADLNIKICGKMNRFDDQENSERGNRSNPNKRERLGWITEPINTERLKPFKQRNKNIVMSILPGGDVSLEYMGMLPDSRYELQEIFKVSHDGYKIEILNIVHRKNDNLYNSSRWKIYQFNELPRCYWRKYLLTSRFVKLMKSKTPRITVYTPRAKCHLMENLPLQDFEANFYDGAKYIVIQNLTNDYNKRRRSNSKFLEDETSNLSVKYIAKDSQSIRDITHLLKSTQSQKKSIEEITNQSQDLSEVMTYRDYTFKIQKSLDSIMHSDLSTNVCISNNRNTAPFPIIIGTNPKRYATFKGINKEAIPTPSGVKDWAHTMKDDKKIIHRNSICDTVDGYNQEASDKLFLPFKETSKYPFHTNNVSTLFSSNNAMGSTLMSNINDKLKDISYEDKSLTINSQNSNFTKYKLDNIPSTKDLVSAYIPGSCWGLFDPTSQKLTAKFLDGIQLIIDLNNMDRIKYIDTNENHFSKDASHYPREINPKSDDISLFIKQKLQKIPLLLENISKNCRKNC